MNLNFVWVNLSFAADRRATFSIFTCEIITVHIASNHGISSAANKGGERTSRPHLVRPCLKTKITQTKNCATPLPDWTQHNRQCLDNIAVPTSYPSPRLGSTTARASEYSCTSS